MPRKPAASIPESLRNFDVLPNSAEVAQPTLKSIFGISDATVWRRVRSGELPQPRRHGKRTTRWNVGELRAILNASPESRGTK